MGPAHWRQLPDAVRQRFSRSLCAGGQVIYRGEVVCTELTWVGWLLAQAARLAGGPLPFTHGATGPSIVVVTEEPAVDGQIWTRHYARPGRFPQVIHSAKRFGGSTGLEEQLGCGLVMRLAVSVEDRSLVFRSMGYALRLGGMTAPLPPVLWPGRCEVRHQPETDARFSFTLTLDHPLFGRLLRQVAFYEEMGR